jgi:hypothetical protein
MTPRLHFCNLGLWSEVTPAQVAGCEARTSGGVVFVGELCHNLIHSGGVLRLVA